MIVHFSKLKSVLIKCLSVICLGHTLSVIYFFDKISFHTMGNHFIFDMFFFEYEKNVTAFFSAGLFIILAVLIHQVSKMDLSFKRQWRFLSFLCIFLACDEWFLCMSN